LTAALDRGTPLVVLSPHLDDAVLSCGALLAHASRRVPVTIATFFTEAGPPPYTLSARRFLQQVGFSDAKRLYQARREEDRAVLEGMGVACVHATLPEALFRRKSGPALDSRWRISRVLPELAHVYPTYRLHITSGRIAPEDADTLRGVVQFTEMLASRGPALMLAPVGVGGHVDHVLVRTAAERNGGDVAYYSEFPYNQRHEVDAGFARRNALIQTTWALELAAKTALILAYRSQADALFPSGRIPLVPEVYLFPNGSRARHDGASAEAA
jgi:LmbE family N-acetylglucosaminyl deacetylase